MSAACSAPSWLQHAACADYGAFGRPASQEVTQTGRASAVLMLFGPGPDGVADPIVVLTERARTLRKHPGQVSFPGGSLDPDDDGPVGAALREAQEEIGLDPAGVQVVGQLPALPLRISGFIVTPVLAWWHRPGPIAVVDVAEVERVLTLRVQDLTEPAHRFTAVHPQRRFAAPAFEIGDVYIWGFTAIVLSEFLDLAGLSRPWDRDDQRAVPERFVVA